LSGKSENLARIVLQEHATWITELLPSFSPDIGLQQVVGNRYSNGLPDLQYCPQFAIGFA
jgi:hypothetical protein